MHPALMAVAAATQLVTPISEAIPKLNVEVTCRGSVEADKAMGLALPQTFDKCMSDENSARQQLDAIWLSYSPAVRVQCEGEATAAGDPSYVDLLTCLQMTDGSVTTSTAALKGASRKRKAPN
ncbi:hypothetical protein [Bradyrhizobium sp. Ai1a-2]|uniref:hypothetical protein n=1 Tax=Bradyrhizobium sp. Ai1a-2 TaxID=196490 RepID=UPI0004859908|nr:hypothetical protein [Bradyrhizobium sp. Ai1a-2]